jgi:hypothetical protein
LRKIWDYIPNMARPKPLQALSDATLQLLRPLVKTLLRNNVSHRTFTEPAKQVNVEIANAEFGIPVSSAADPIIVLLGASIDTSLIPESGVKGGMEPSGEAPSSAGSQAATQLSSLAPFWAIR